MTSDYFVVKNFVDAIAPVGLHMSVVCLLVFDDGTSVIKGSIWCNNELVMMNQHCHESCHDSCQFLTVC